MDNTVIAEHLKLPPEQVRLARLYPELPNPIPFAEAGPVGPWNEYDEHPPELRGCFYICFPFLPGTESYAVTGEHYRIVEEYEDVHERQVEAEKACAAARWENRGGDGEPREPEPEAIPPRGDLTPRQEEFCRHYATQPVATRAAVLAGYSEESADTYGPRLLKNPLVLDRIAQMRAARNIQYVVERDTLHDKLEAVFFGALAERNHAAAVAALRLQAALGGLSLRPGGSQRATAGEQAAPDQARFGKVGAGSRGKSGKVGAKRPKTSGKVGKSR